LGETAGFKRASHNYATLEKASIPQKGKKTTIGHSGNWVVLRRRVGTGFHPSET